MWGVQAAGNVVCGVRGVNVVWAAAQGASALLAFSSTDSHPSPAGICCHDWFVAVPSTPLTQNPTRSSSNSTECNLLCHLRAAQAQHIHTQDTCASLSDSTHAAMSQTLSQIAPSLSLLTALMLADLEGPVWELAVPVGDPVVLKGALGVIKVLACVRDTHSTMPACVTVLVCVPVPCVSTHAHTHPVKASSSPSPAYDSRCSAGRMPPASLMMLRTSSTRILGLTCTQAGHTCVWLRRSARA